MKKNLNTFIDEEDDIDLDELLDLGPEKPWSKAQLLRWKKAHLEELKKAEAEK